MPTNVMLVRKEAPSTFRHVLVCTDFERASLDALQWAKQLVIATPGSVLEVLHVFNGPWHHIHYGTPTPSATPDFKKQYSDALEQRMHAITDELALPPEQVKQNLIDAPNTPDAILRYARESSVDLVAVGTSKTGFLRKFFLGSNAERVVQSTSCSVVAVRERG